MVGCAAGHGDLSACYEKDEAWVANTLQATLSTYARAAPSFTDVLKIFGDLSLGTLHVSLNGYARSQHADDRLSLITTL